jgi:hypothetical protein
MGVTLGINHTTILTGSHTGKNLIKAIHCVFLFPIQDKPNSEAFSQATL